MILPSQVSVLLGEMLLGEFLLLTVVQQQNLVCGGEKIRPGVFPEEQGRAFVGMGPENQRGTTESSSRHQLGQLLALGDKRSW